MYPCIRHQESDVSIQAVPRGRRFDECNQLVYFQAYANTIRRICLSAVRDNVCRIARHRIAAYLHPEREGETRWAEIREPKAAGAIVSNTHVRLTIKVGRISNDS